MEYTKLLGKVTLTCDGKHDSSKEYDRLCLVYDEQYRSFISIKEVPSNISLTNESYWQPISVVYADGEDIKVDDDLSLKFADKEYNPSKYSGLGRKILRKRIVNNKNILLQTDFDSSDTIYVIQYEFDLQGKTITIPNNSILLFEGGKFVNGDVVLNDTMILPQGIDVAEHIEGNVTGTYKDGQIYYDSIKDSLIAVVNNNKIDLSTPNITNEYTKFTWIKYSPSQYGDQMTDQPEEDSQYIGIASNKETEEPSNNPLDYMWAKFVGPQGAQGLRGERGFQGPQGEQGPPGKDGLDGKPGQSVKPNWNTWVFKQAELQPSKPTFVTPTPGVSGIDGWFDGPSAEGKWWMSMGLVDGSTNTVATWSDPVQCTAEDGKTNTYMDFKYSKSVSINIIPALNKTSRNPVGWEDTPPTLAPGEFMWMINALIDENNELVKEWQGPIRITGEQGPQGEPGQGEPGDTYNTVFAYKSSIEKPEKPVGGEWDADTNIIVYPEGWSSNDEELTPPVWMSNKVFTSNPNIQGEWSEPIKISGQDGAAGTDGNSVEFIYTRTTDSGVGDTPETPVGEDVDDFIPLNWTDNPKGVTSILKAEWVSTRSKKDNKWGGFSTPALWSKWGENGQDGDGVQYIFYRTATNNDPDNPTPNNTNSDAYQETGDFEGIEYIPGDGWTDNPQGVTKELQYEWVCQRKFRGGRWRAYTGPSLWAKYGKDGLDGLGSIVLDLDNEVQSVATDNLGAVISGLPVTTKLTMYYGTTELNLSSLSVRQVDGITATADRKTGIITVSTITPSAPTNIRIPIDASCIWNNELIERTTYLTINKIKPGADGQDAILYSLVPSVDAMHVDKKGVADVKFISCGIKKTQGEVTTMLTSPPSGFQFKYVIDEDLAENYTIDQNLSVTSIDKKVTFLLTSGETLVDKETVFKISDGKDGVDGVGGLVTDFDNDMQSVACDSKGNVISGLPLTTTVSMYYGTTKLVLDSLAVGSVEGITASANASTGVITVTSISSTTGDVIRIPVNVKASNDGTQYIRDVIFTINKIRPGADGENAKVYSLLPSVNAIHRFKDDSNEVNSVWCDLQLKEGDTVKTLSTTPTGYKFTYKVDNGGEANYSIGSVVASSSITAQVTFTLYDERSGNRVTVDTETIYVIRDGKDGEDGQPGTVPNWKTYVYKQSNTKPDKPTFRVPQPGGLDGWVDFPDSSTGQWWQCIGLVYGETNSVHVWGEVVPLNGKDGVAQDGKYTEFRFKAVTTGYSPGTPQQVRNPAGWNTTVPSVDESIETLWMIMAVITPNDALESGWSTPVRISGETGQDGEPGATLYTWIKYSDNEPTSDADIYDAPNRYTKYIGIAYNKTSPVESTDYEVYEWTKWVGADGNKGRIIYPVGTYSDSKTYTCTDEKAPYVFFNDEYYVMNKNGNWLGTSIGKTPEQDWNTNGSNATWILMDKYEALFTKILIADGGSMGKFIFNGDYMFSQEGVDGGGNATSDYQNFTNNTVNFTNHFTMPSDSNWVDEVSIETYKVTVRNAVVSMMWGVNTNIVSTTKQTPEFKIKVKGVKTYPSATVQLQYKYIKNGNLEYIQIPITSSTVEYTLPASEAGSGGDYTTSIEIAQFGTGSLSVSFEFYISNVFIPNFMVNAVTGQVDMNKGVIRMRSAEEYDKLYYSQLTGSTSVYRPNITSNKQLMVIDDIGATDYTISLPFNDAYEGMSLYIFYTSTTGTGNYALRIVTENSQSDLPGGVGKFLYNGSLSLSIITLTPNKFVQLKYTNMASGYVMSGGTVVPFNCPAWMVENGSDFQKQI